MAEMNHFGVSRLNNDINEMRSRNVTGEFMSHWRQHIAQIIRSPLLWGELTRFLRSAKSFLTLFIFQAVFWVVVMQNWSSFTSHWAPGQDTAAGARELFFYLTFGHLLLVSFVTPFLMAPSISGEREQDTMTLIFSSPISIPHILIAKLLSPLLFMMLLLVSTSPALSLCFLGGGLDIAAVGRTYVILLTATLTLGCMGLYCSTLRPRVYEVYLVSAGMLLFFMLLIPYHGSVWEYLSNFHWYQTSDRNHGLQYISPFFAFANEFSVPGYLRRRQSFIPDPIGALMTGKLAFFNYAQGTYLWASGLISLGFLAAAAAQLRRIAKGVAFHWAVAEPESNAEEEWIPVYEREDTISFDDTSQEGNPGKALEQRVQWFAKLPVLIRLFYASLMISIITLPLASYNGSWLFLSLPFISAALFTLPLSATSISSDRERGLMDLVRTTLLSPRQLIEAKFSANLQYSFLIALALYVPGMSLQLICSFLGYEVDLATDSSSRLAIVLYPVILFLSLFFYTAFGLYCSALFKRTNQALIASGSIVLTTLSIPFFLPPAPSFSTSPLIYLATLSLSMLSPLMGVAVLFPQDNISIIGRALLDVSDHSFWVPVLFILTQCGLCLAGTHFLVQQAIKQFNQMD